MKWVYIWLLGFTLPLSILITTFEVADLKDKLDQVIERLDKLEKIEDK